MRNCLFFFFLNVFALQAQKDSVHLVDIQSSECKAMIEVQPGFVKKEMVGDTTLIDLFCSNNCGGYHDPTVKLSGDSVLITILGGKHYFEPKIYYKVEGELYNNNELKYREKEYHRKYDRSDSIVLNEEHLIKTICDCCYRFNLKIVGLDSLVNYNYYYNHQYIDPAYKTTGEVKIYQFPYFLNTPQYEVFGKLKKTIYKSKDKTLLEDLHSFHLYIYITADTVSGAIKNVEVEYPYDRIKNKEWADKVLIDYFMSLSPIIPIQNISKTKWIQEYVISFGFNWETDQLEMTYDAGESQSGR